MFLNWLCYSKLSAYCMTESHSLLGAIFWFRVITCDAKHLYTSRYRLVLSVCATGSCHLRCIGWLDLSASIHERELTTRLCRLLSARHLCRSLLAPCRGGASSDFVQMQMMDGGWKLFTDDGFLFLEYLFGWCYGWLSRFAPLGR